MNELELVDWRRQVSALYVAVRGEGCAETAHARWRTGLDTLLREHPRSPLEPSDRLRTTGMSYSSGGLSVDLNFLYHPPCPYSSERQCPLAPAGNTIAFRVRGGEQGNRALLATCHWKSGRLHDVDSSAGSSWSRGDCQRSTAVVAIPGSTVRAQHPALLDRPPRPGRACRANAGHE